MTISETIRIDNLKCGGCGSTIKKTLKNIEGVNNVSIDFDKDEVSVIHTEGVNRELLTDALKRMGYPETGTTEGLSAVAATAKSFVSCAIGRMSDNES
ncbi:MAG: heavy-metal-associated domain-containing protein [Saprospiraceae bacterium]|nr:heavy-metal-associated domain-containing protein [Saprospiraceae bacterium]